MTALLRTAYRTFVPEPVRRFRWGLKNAFGDVFKDATPRSVRFDYDSYWATKEQEDALWLSYRRELIALCEARIETGASVLDVGCGNGILLLHLKLTPPQTH